MKSDYTTKEIAEETKKLFDAANAAGLNIQPKCNSQEEFDKDFFSGEALSL